ncbi:MAG: hypothetical protein ACJA0E_000270 [Bermanella sp.]|jgi:hypothetical protein
MVIGIVVSVIEKENAKEDAEHNTEPTLSELQQEIKELKSMIQAMPKNVNAEGKS